MPCGYPPALQLYEKNKKNTGIYSDALYTYNSIDLFGIYETNQKGSVEMQAALLIMKSIIKYFIFFIFFGIIIGELTFEEIVQIISIFLVLLYGPPCIAYFIYFIEKRHLKKNAQRRARKRILKELKQELEKPI